MTSDDLETLARGMAPIVRDFVDAAVGPLKAQIAELRTQLAAAEQPAMVPGPIGPVGPAGEPGRAGVDGASVTAKDVEPLIADAVTKAVALIPVPKDGVSVDPSEVDAMVSRHVAKAVAALPAPKDGTSVTVADVEPLIAEHVQKAVAAIPAAKDGIGVTSALIDRDGHLVIALSDGYTKDVGLVVGKDADPADITRAVVEEVAKIPKPKDGEKGEDGKHGRDGTIENLKLVRDGDRSLKFCFKNGDPIEGGDVTLPAVVYRGIYEDGKAYETGDSVTWGGSLWIAKESTTAKPGLNDAASRAWQLAVKSGRDGKSITGPQGPAGPKGDKGDPGRNGY